MKALIFAIAALVLGSNAFAITVNKQCTGLPAQEWDRDSKGELNYTGQYKGLGIQLQINEKSIVVTDPKGYFPGEFTSDGGKGRFPAPVNQEYVSYYGQTDDSYLFRVQKSLLSPNASGIVWVEVFAEGNDYGIFHCEDAR